MFCHMLLEEDAGVYVCVGIYSDRMIVLIPSVEGGFVYLEMYAQVFDFQSGCMKQFFYQ